MSDKKNTVTVNLIDINGDGKIEMISFMNNKGSVGLAIDYNNNSAVDQIYIFQDITGDGVLNQDDEIRLREKANEIFAKYPKNAPSQITLAL